jgi:hypothetical protein
MQGLWSPRTTGSVSFDTQPMPGLEYSLPPDEGLVDRPDPVVNSESTNSPSLDLADALGHENLAVLPAMLTESPSTTPCSTFVSAPGAQGATPVCTLD